MNSFTDCFYSIKVAGSRMRDLNTLHYSPTFYFLLFTFYFLTGCQKEAPRSIIPAFYHWQTNLEITPKERQLIDSLGVEKLYVKFFDVDVNESGELVPHAEVQIDTHLLNDLKIIPTVFITNRTFKDISQKEVESLAEKIFNKIQSFTHSTILSFEEIQFDCDWTQSTRENYFYFLEYFRTINNQQLSISSTIRLHQLKYPEQTGIPPVDRGMLMFYNTGDLASWETQNSILDLQTANHYLTPNNQYPIPLDIALPIFKWGVIYRNGELVYLINNLSEKDLQDSTRFAELHPNRVQVIKSTYLDGYYLYEGDLIRLENITPELLNDAANVLVDRLPSSRKTQKSDMAITFYHLDTTTLEDFSLHDFQIVLGHFSEK